ncbi:MAG: AAA domain-containing protein [Rhodothermaceae bacterium]|nr:AAA domain-containing protein [Rhodothermaceae bacterium]
MRELFQWVPWFEELAKKVRECRREGLVERVNKVDWPEKMTVAVLADGENRADPLTFFYHLASIAGGKAENRTVVFESIADVFGIESPLDCSNDECFIFPIPPGLIVRFNNNTEDNTQLLWEIFDRACRLDGTAYDVDLTDTFADMLDIKVTDIQKLTQVLFLVNPRAFLPFDNASILPLGLGKYEGVPKDKKMPWAEYLAEMNRIRDAFSGCQCYEINVICYLWNTNGGYLPLENIRWYQINTTEDRCIDFLENNWVYYGKPWVCFSVFQRNIPLNKPEPGDVIFVHSGRHNVYGIGVVYRNDYHEPSHANGRIHVLWINKKQWHDVDIFTPLTPFSQVDMDSYQVLTNIPAYTAILGLLSGPPMQHNVEQWHEGLIRNTPPGPKSVTTPPIKAEAKHWYKEQFKSARVWAFNASKKHWNEFKEKHIIAIGWDDLGDLQAIDDREDISNRIQEITGASNPVMDSLACYQFAHKMQHGDPVIAIRGGHSLLGYDVIESDYTFDESRPEARHVRKIRWIKTGIWTLPERRCVTAKTLTDFSPWKWWVLFAFRLMEISNSLPSTGNHKLNQILYGPPGTGKTYSTTARAMAIVKGIKLEEVTEEHRKEFRDLRFDSNKGSGQIEMVTFHQNYSYEDFVEGIRPSLGEEGGLDYELRPGVFRIIVKAALDNPHCRFVLIIDEINRGNIPKILGDLITLIEPSRRLGQNNETTVTLPYSGDSFGVPGNLFIIGTMNTADRSILPLDIALRRRFDHVEMMPDPGHELISDNVDGIDLRKMLKAINSRISLLLDRERQIGHTYLFNVKSVESLANIFKTAILPLLLEYFYDDWSKVQKVLGGAGFIKKNSNKEYLDHLKKDDITDSDIYERIPWNTDEWLEPNQYRSIYEKIGSADNGEPIDEGSDTLGNSA